ncbi:transposase [Halpernia frigidisoli]|uniref:transposase n=1 Tax=Halpernia frigidisoli TaxID=1125876 RepID=UPI0011605159|nr:transposase [Halpernia frigidisoli]
MKNINVSRNNFMLHLFSLFLSIKGRLNFLQLERFRKFDEQSYRNNFEKEFEFLEFNKNLIKEHCSPNLAIAFDPSFISKSGKKTPGTGYFWSGCAGRTKWGLEISGLAAIDCENHTALHLEAVQTVGLKENETLVHYYLKIILERKNGLQELSKCILVDAYFSKTTFVNPLVNEGFTIISRLRDDADLRYNFEGE